MLFNSVDFQFFLPVVLLIYFLIPCKFLKVKNLWLLVVSYYFYMSWNAKYIILIFASTVITYLCGLALEKIKRSDFEDEKKTKYKKIAMVCSLVINLGILGYFKYTNFFLDVIQDALSALHISLNIPTFDILLPVGISFYTFQAIGYTIDVYRDDIYAEKSFVQYALFVSFFPQLVAGPIERSKNLIKQLAVAHKFEFDNLKKGVLLMIWGYFLKIVIADRIALFDDTVFQNYQNFSGWYIVLAVLLANIQVYCDFYGYSIIATGVAKILGINLMENFDTPFFSHTIGELWKRWHVSLTSWFTDYIYFPLGGSRKGKARKWINVMIVFFLSGLWHGASINYVVWGLINGLYQVIGGLLMPFRKKTLAALRINVKSLGYRLAQIAVTFWLFAFSAITQRVFTWQAIKDVTREFLFPKNPWILFDGSLYEAGLNQKNFTVLLVSMLILLIADLFKYNKIVLSDVILRQDRPIRWICFIAGIVLVLVFGLWGPAFDKANFYYFQF